MLLHRYLSGAITMKITNKKPQIINLHPGGVGVKGFTLIELLIVIVILGLLMGLGVNNFQSSQIKARDTNRKNDLAQIQKALELYYNDYGQYPDLDIDSLSGTQWQDDNETLYMKEFPQDPRFGDYYYVLGANGTSYQLYARLENSNDPQIGVYDGTVCGDGACNYGVASSNVNP